MDGKLNKETEFLNSARLHEAALVYRRWEYHVEPIVDVGGGWQPLFDWDNVDYERYEEDIQSRIQKGETRDEAEVHLWFDDNQNPVIRGLAVLLGRPHPFNVQCRRFYSRCAYEAWRDSHQSWAERLPTVCTCKGFDVYFRRLSLQSGVLTLTDGEICGANALCLVPPTTYGGVTCKWLANALPPYEVPLAENRWEKLDIGECGLFDTYPVE